MHVCLKEMIQSMSFLKKSNPPIKMSANVIAHLRFCLSKFLSNEQIFKDFRTNDLNGLENHLALNLALNHEDLSFLKMHRLMGLLKISIPIDQATIDQGQMIHQSYWQQQAFDFELAYFFDQIYPHSCQAPILIKGSDTSRSIWRDPGLRSISDWDLWLASSNFQVFHKYIQENRQVFLSKGIQIEEVKDQDQIISLHLRKNHLLIEFHHHLIPNYLLHHLKKNKNKQKTDTHLSDSLNSNATLVFSKQWMVAIDQYTNRLDPKQSLMLYGLQREIRIPTPQSRWLIFLINQAKNACQGYCLQDLIEFFLILVDWKRSIEKENMMLRSDQILEQLILFTSGQDLDQSLFRTHLLILVSTQNFLKQLDFTDDEINGEIVFFNRYLKNLCNQSHLPLSKDTFYLSFLSKIVDLRLNQKPLRFLSIHFPIPNIIITLCFWYTPLSIPFFLGLWFRWRSFHRL
jgi:hypothetical protein